MQPASHSRIFPYYKSLLMSGVYGWPYIEDSMWHMLRETQLWNLLQSIVIDLQRMHLSVARSAIPPRPFASAQSSHATQRWVLWGTTWPEKRLIQWCWQTAILLRARKIRKTIRVCSHHARNTLCDTCPTLWNILKSWPQHPGCPGYSATIPNKATSQNPTQSLWPRQWQQCSPWAELTESKDPQKISQSTFHLECCACCTCQNITSNFCLDQSSAGESRGRVLRQNCKACDHWVVREQEPSTAVSDAGSWWRGSLPTQLSRQSHQSSKTLSC